MEITARTLPYRLADDAVPEEHADRILQSRRLVSVRALLEMNRREALNLLTSWRPGMPDSRSVALSALELIDAAVAEVEEAERGCGQPDGECLDPCHLGILAPTAG